MSRRDTRWTPASDLVFGALLLAGLIIRVLAMRSTWGQPDGDDAMVMMMAYRASHGHFALLFWGGNYGGAVITWIEGPLVALFGMKIWLFRTVDTLQCVGAAILLRAIGRRILSPIAADVAAGTFFFFPALWLFWSTREYIFWLPATLFALATCLLILKWNESRRPRLLWAIGLCAGLAIWSYPLIFPLVAPALAVLAWNLRKDRNALARVALAGVAGVAPWLAFFAVHGRAATHLQTVTGSRTADLRHTVTQVLPTALIGGVHRVGVVWGVRTASSRHLAVLGAGIYLATAVYTACAIRGRNVAIAVCGASVLMWPFVLVIGHVPISSDTYRYGVIPVAPLLLLGAHACSRVRGAPLLAGLVALGLTFSTVWRETSGFDAAPSCFPPLVETSRFLVAEHRTAVWGSYWLSAPLEICAQQRVSVGSVSLPFRDHAAQVNAASARRSTYVVFPGRELDEQLRAWTKGRNVNVTRIDTTGFAVWEFDRVVPPAAIGLDGAF